VHGLAGPFTASTTWNSQPGIVAGPPAHTSAMANQAASAPGCSPNWEGLTATSLVQGWVSGAANHGLGLRADESDMSAFQHFWSAFYSTGAYSPYLYVTWDRLANPPGNVFATPNADGSVTVTWDEATLPPDASAVDWYVVHALNPDLSYAGETAVVCGTCTTATLTNLARSKDYVFGVYPHNGAGYNFAPSNQVPTPADPLVRAGDGPFFSYDTFAINDRLAASVNVGTGNLQLSTVDIAVPVVGGARAIGRSYNSFALSPASTSKVSPLFGPSWRFSEAPDRRLLVHSDGSVTYLSGGGHATVFAAGTLAPPTGVDASLVKNPDGTYTLADIPSGGMLHFRADGLLTSEVDRNANTISFTYPAGGGYQTSIAGNAGTAPGNTVNITYGDGGKVSALSQTAGSLSRSVSYAYDAAGYLHQVTDAGGTTTYDYDPATRDLITITDPAGHITRFTYDSSRRVEKVIRDLPGNDDPVTTYAYPTPTQTTVTDANGNPPATYTFHPDGRLQDSVNARGVKTVVTWTPQLRVDKVEVVEGTLVQTLIDNLWSTVTGSALPDLLKVSSPTGAFTEAGGYGSGVTARQPGWTTDTMGFQTAYAYDPKGNLASVTDALSRTARVERNADGTVARAYSPKYPDSNPTVYGYTNHQLTSVDPPGTDLGSTAATYDGFGRLRTSTSGEGVTTTFEYDLLDRVKNQSHSDATPTISYTYDGAGNVATRIDGTATTDYTYDEANRPLTKTGGLSWTWDRAGNLKTATDPGGSASYSYDILNRLHQVNEAPLAQAGQPPPPVRKSIYAYDIFGRRTDTWHNTGSDIVYLGNTVIPPASFAVHTKATYDAAGQLSELKTTRASSDVDPGKVVSHLRYSYDVADPNPCAEGVPGRPTGIRHAVTDVVAAKTTAYCYDKAGRMTSATTSPGGPTYTYAFDANTNRTAGPEGAHTLNVVDQLTDSGFDYNLDGSLIAGGGLSLGYTGIDQTESITKAGATTDYGYAGGGQGERTTAGPTTALHGMAGMVSETTAGATTYYVRDAAGALILQRTPTAGDFYYVHDGQGSVIALVDPSGTQRAAYAYDPYGDHATATAMNGTLPPNPWRWIGSYLDATGLYKMGARYYDPVQGRFTQLDPVAGGSANGYDYCAGDPVNCWDGSGTKGQRPLPDEPLCFRSEYPYDLGYNSMRCVLYREAVRTGDSSKYFKYFNIDEPVREGGCPKYFTTIVETAGVGGAGRAVGDLANSRWREAARKLWASALSSGALTLIAKAYSYPISSVATGFDIYCANLG
jgi:RHS repeat-associated protein